MALFRQKTARDPAQRRTADLEALRARWEEHQAKLPPEPSQASEFVEMRAAIAECDVRMSRFVGAVVSGHAVGLNAPFDAVGEYAEKVAAMDQVHAVRTPELKFFTEESVEVGRIVLEASRLQRNAP
jgi:hypothetical protein